jgi:GDP-4-dehydro-6-deoxy-D-mannose reductase
MRVYVTGAGGFVGRRLIRRLEAEGHETTATDSEVDVTDPVAVATSVRDARPEALVHLAAVSSVAASLHDPNLAERVNLEGARSVIGALEQHAPGARLLLVGSGDMYGVMAPGDAPRSERDPLAPRSPYARSKAAAEVLGNEAAARGLDVIRLRPFNHTGAGQTPQFVASDFAKQVSEIAAGRRAPQMRVGNLDSLRDFLHVDDVLDAYLGLLDRSAPADIYNVASGEGTSIRDLLEMLCDIADVAPDVEIDPERFRPTDWVIGDASRLRKATGWKPTRTLRDALVELVEYWRSSDA